jgi:hypothetical protein
VACARGGFAEEGHLRYYEAAAPRKAVARDLSKIRAMGLLAGDPAREKALSVSLLFPPLSLCRASLSCFLGKGIGWGKHWH